MKFNTRTLIPTKKEASFPTALKLERLKRAPESKPDSKCNTEKVERRYTERVPLGLHPTMHVADNDNDKGHVYTFSFTSQ